MLIRHSFDQRFFSEMDSLRKKYGEKMFELSGIGDKDLDINRYSQDYFSIKGAVADKTIDSNANMADTSVVAWENESQKPLRKLNALYIIWSQALEKYGIKRANKILEHEICGAIRVHDAHMWSRPYCYAADLSALVTKGMPFYSAIKIGPPKHFNSYMDLTAQLVAYMSNQLAGALALPNLLIYAEYFIRKDFGENWYTDQVVLGQVNQIFQSFLFSLNYSWRSVQTPFVNVSVFDRPWLEHLTQSHVNPDFSKPDISNIMRVQRMFVDEMVRNLKNNPFTFPVMTAALVYDKESQQHKDQEFLNYISEVEAETGLFNIYSDYTTASLSSCCRLRNNIEEANKEYFNSFGSGGLSIGSTRVVTVNLPQIGFISEDWAEFMKNLEYRVTLAQDILDLHREHLRSLIDKGFQPLYTYGFMHLEKQFSTLGFIGMHEALEIMGADITTEEGARKCQEIIGLMNDMNTKRSKADGNIRNVEQIPGESAASNFATKDRIQFNDCKYELYSNQYIPLVKEVPMTDRIIAQGRFDRAVGGGSILHLNIEEKVEKEQVKKLLDFTSRKGVVYFAINYNFSACTSCGKVHIGRMEKSPCHSAPVKKFLRVVGYLSEVGNWPKPRRAEYGERQFYGSDAIR